jgi:hypothetical protein
MRNYERLSVLRARGVLWVEIKWLLICANGAVSAYTHRYQDSPVEEAVWSSFYQTSHGLILRRKSSIIRSLESPSSILVSEKWQKESYCTYCQARRDRKQSQSPTLFRS